MKAAPPVSLTTDYCLLIRDGRVRAVELLDGDGEGLVVALRAVAQHGERDLLAEQDRPVGRAAEVYAGVDAVAEGDVVRELVQLAVDVELAGVRARVAE